MDDKDKKDREEKLEKAQQNIAVGLIGILVSAVLIFLGFMAISFVFLFL